MQHIPYETKIEWNKEAEHFLETKQKQHNKIQTTKRNKLTA